MMIKFVVLGEPKRKGRPRFRTNGRFVQTYTDSETAEYEQLVKLSFINSGCEPFMNSEYLSVNVDAYFPIPGSTSNKKKQLMLSNKIRHNKKPDADNVLKAILDALNKVAYGDDSKIVDLACHKFYSDTPRVEIEIKEVCLDD